MSLCIELNSDNSSLFERYAI